MEVRDLLLPFWFSGAPSFAPTLLLQRKLKKGAKGGSLPLSYVVILLALSAVEGSAAKPACSS
jgi:ABC-type Na+ efflux pump permease subunit